MRGQVPLIVALLTLSGCSGGAEGDGGGLSATDDTGLVRGIVVDDAVRPVANATVKLTGPETTLNATTDATGAFGFDGLPAGSYFVRVAKPLYDSVQQTVIVEAGLDEPPEVRVVLVARPDLKPYFLDEAWDGYIECSVRVGTGPLGITLGVNACNDVGEQNVEYVYSVAEPSVNMLQAELTWEDSQSLGSALSFVAGPPDCTDVDYARQDGVNPLVHRFYRPDLAAFQGTEGLCFRVFTYTTEESQHFAGVVVAQEFRAFYHQFYNFLPPAEWQFSTHGQPVVP